MVFFRIFLSHSFSSLYVVRALFCSETRLRKTINGRNCIPKLSTERSAVARTRINKRVSANILLLLALPHLNEFHCCHWGQVSLLVTAQMGS